MTRDNPFDRLPFDRYFVSRPPPVEREAGDETHFEEKYWSSMVDPDGNPRNKLAERDLFLKNARDELAHINALPPGRILDVGTGPGFFLSGVDPSWERFGVEISRFAAEHARQWGDVYNGTLEAARYPDRFFDVVISRQVIEHVPDPIALILEMRRILTDDGWLILATPNFDSGCARRFGENYRLLLDKTHITLFSSDSLKRLLRDHGLRTDKTEYPFFDTIYFTEENLRKLFDPTQISPAFYGNLMTFYARKMSAKECRSLLEHMRGSLEAAVGPLEGS